ncbi:VWA domain-containing protein [Pseudaeromonas paramecii]|uniref:VWA domain-containing protein n=1 Tax=Pseudaeromonas paramecii TaxID=2138166 RepID=A0ABP8QH11_9GAMM
MLDESLALLARFHFLRPGWLLALLPLAALLYGQWRELQQQEQWQRRLPPHLRDALTVGQHSWQRYAPLLALTLIGLLTTLVAAGPTWRRAPSPFSADQAALMVLLDTSDAMQEKDVPPDRLQRAKQKIQDLLTLRAGGQTGLIAYAGSAHLTMPLTRDTDVFAPLLNALGPSVMPRPGQDSSQVLPLLPPLLPQSGPPLSLLLLTNDVDPSQLDAWQSFCEAHSVALLILPMGDPRRPSDLPLQRAHLQALADRCRGRLHDLTLDDGDMRWVKAQVEAMAELDPNNRQPWQEMGYGLLLPIMLLMLLWFRRGWLVQWALLGLLLPGLLLSSPAQAEPARHLAAGTATDAPAAIDWPTRLKNGWLDLWLTADQQGQWYWRQGDYLTAAEHYQDLRRKAIAYYYAGQYASAERLFARFNDPQMRLYHANALARQRQYVAARASLQALLKAQPDFAPAQHNLQQIQALIEEINRQTESQAGGENAMERSRELGEAPQTSDGVQEQVARDSLIQETLDADSLLTDPTLVDKWLKRVQQRPESFLRAKFAIQLRQREDGHVTP